MRLTWVAPHRNATLGLVFLFVFALASVGLVLAQNPPAQQQTPPAQQQPQQQQTQQAAPTHIFAAESGMVVNYVKPDKTADFEALIAKLKDGLQKSQNPERKQMAAAWKVFKADVNGPNGSVIYIFYMDQVVKGADYTMSKLLYEAFPTETQELYKRIADAYVGQQWFNLTLVSNLAQ